MLAQAYIKAQLSDLEAFCSECPAPEEVTAFLETLGFHLVFTMPRKNSIKRGKMTLPPLPAQYHYRDQHNTELIFLAGRDYPEYRMVFPAHASRWLLYPGTSQCSYDLVTQELSALLGLQWKRQVTSKLAAKEAMYAKR